MHIIIIIIIINKSLKILPTTAQECSVGTSCARNPEQIKVKELEGYSQPTCMQPLRARSS